MSDGFAGYSALSSLAARSTALSRGESLLRVSEAGKLVRPMIANEQ
jgi:hypothetical protein